MISHSLNRFLSFRKWIISAFLFPNISLNDLTCMIWKIVFILSQDFIRFCGILCIRKKMFVDKSERKSSSIFLCTSLTCETDKFVCKKTSLVKFIAHLLDIYVLSEQGFGSCLALLQSQTVFFLIHFSIFEWCCLNFSFLHLPTSCLQANNKEMNEHLSHCWLTVPYTTQGKPVIKYSREPFLD